MGGLIALMVWGLTVEPAEAPPLGLMLFLLAIPGVVIIGVLLAPFKPSLGQFAVISWAGLRGAASIVFAIMVTVNDSFAGGDIYHIVFCVVLYSIILQGTLRADPVQESEHDR